jgi:hypothetical protein
VRFEVLMMMSMQMAVFWSVALCSVVDIDRLITLMMEAVSSSEMLVNIYQATWCNIPEDSHLKTPYSEMFLLRNLHSKLTFIIWE